MNMTIASIGATPTQPMAAAVREPLPSHTGTVRKDRVDLGKSPLTDAQSMNIMVERAYERLRAAVAQAREDLGIPKGAPLDTSAEATAGRIADFALGAFEAWWRNHDELGEQDAREQFTGFIGGAIQEGIEEARGILSALNALTPEADYKINKIWELVQQRLDDFAAND